MKKLVQSTLWFCVMLFLLAPQTILACAVCAGGKSDSALAEGMNMGILTLLGVVVFVLSGVAAFGIYLVRRAAAYARMEKENELPEPAPRQV